MRKTKIICTIGPATDSPDMLRELMRNGMNVARLNFSHGNHEEQLVRVNHIKDIRNELNLPVAILMDTKGPEIRTQIFENGCVTVESGATVRISEKDVIGTAEVFSITFKELAQDLHIGSQILIDDGLIELTVTAIEGKDIVCKVVNGGEIANHKSMNLPGVELHLPALTEKDEQDLEFAVEQDFDFIAASFVRKASDVLEIRRVLERFGCRNMRIIAKIENQEGVNNFEKILEVADGIMVARGDLGVEIPAHEVPTIQKHIIQLAYRMGKPSITATQMLDSMIRNPRPTRAEASDVANAVLDGTSALMLSGETAMGKYPIQSLQMMHKIATYTEDNIDYWKEFKRAPVEMIPTIANAISHACCMTAADLNAKAILTVTHSGRTARLISRFRPECPIIATTVTNKARYQLAMSWGVDPYLIEEVHSTDELFEMSLEKAKKEKLVQDGDLVIISSGTPVGMSGTTNTLKVSMVGAVKCQGTPRTSQPHKRITGDVVLANELVNPTGELVVDVSQLPRHFVLVAEETNPKLLPMMRQAKAVVVEDADPDCHAVTVCEALEIPVIYDCENATKLLRTGQLALLDMDSGLIN